MVTAMEVKWPRFRHARNGVFDEVISVIDNTRHLPSSARANSPSISDSYKPCGN